MAQKQSSNSHGSAYSSAFFHLYRGMVYARDRLGAAKNKVVLRARGINRSSQSDRAAFGKIREAISGFECYREEESFRFIRERALLKGFDDLESYYAFLCDNEAERTDLQENLTNVGSHFFRGDAWLTLRSVCEQAFSGSGEETIRIWCAGCASGKEVYSVLMLLRDFLPAERIELLATDYNHTMLERCKEGAYNLRTLDEIPVQYRRYTEKYKPVSLHGKVAFADKYKFRFCDELRSLVQTQPHNLLFDEYPSGFDLILCRNVIKFFDPAARQVVQCKLAASLNPGGTLVVSDEEAEHIADPAALGLEQVEGSCIYLKTL